MKDIPTLTGKTADRFQKMSEENLKRKGTIDFTEQAENSKKILKKRSMGNNRKTNMTQQC